MANLCQDCKHFRPDRHEEFCRCDAVKSVSPITGKKKGSYCSIERTSLFGLFGPEGKLFEPKLEMA